MQFKVWLYTDYRCDLFLFGKVCVAPVTRFGFVIKMLLLCVTDFDFGREEENLLKSKNLVCLIIYI